MYEFTKKTVEEDVNAMILFSSENSGDSCKNYGVCGDVDGVCGV